MIPAADDSQVWDLLSKAPGRPAPDGHDLDLFFTETRGYPLLDLLFAKVIARLLPDYSWVLEVGSGPDLTCLRGEHSLFELPVLDVRGHDLITGCCTHSRRSGFRALQRALHAVLEPASPAHLLLLSPDPVSEQLRAEVARECGRIGTKAIAILGRTELEYLFSQHLEYLRSSIRENLDVDQARLVERHLESLPPFPPLAPAVEVTLPPKGETGVPFVVTLVIKLSLPVEQLILRWEWQGAMLGSTATSPVQLISSPAAARTQGLALDLRNRLTLAVRLKFRSFQAGRQLLGSFGLYSEENRLLTRVSAGAIEVVELYEPAFYRAPYLEHLNVFDDFLRQSESGHVHAVVVVGSAGSGKTRLCEEFGFSSEQRGFRWISRSHPHHQDQPYKIFADLLRSLVPEPFSTEPPGEVVTRYLAGLAPSLATAGSGVLAALFPFSGRPRPATSNFGEDLFLRIFLTLLIDQSSQQPLCIHLSDLHWCGGQSLRLLEEAIGRLGELERSRETRVLFLLEGRVGEALDVSGASGENDDPIADAWESFSQRVGTRRVAIAPLDTRASRDFLVQLFETFESTSRRVPPELIPLQEELLTAICRRGEGNPFHMVEQIKYYRTLGFIKQNERTGLLFLVRLIGDQADVPDDVRGLIRKRFAYVRQRHPGMAALIRAVAVLGDRISGPLFSRLRERLAREESLDVLVRSEFISLPRGEAGEVRFRHENYFQVLKDLELDQRDAVIEIYRAWLEDQQVSGDTLFDQGRLLLQSFQPDLAQAYWLFSESLRRYEEQEKFQMSARALEHLLRLQPDTPSGLLQLDEERMQAAIDQRMLLAKRITWTGDFSSARRLLADQIDLLQALLRDSRQIASLEHALFSAQVELANIELHIFSYAEAIARLEGSLPALATLARRATDPTLDWKELEVRATNRLGVALWFDGQPARAIWMFRRSLHLAQAIDNRLQISQQLRDLGTARIHVNAGAATRNLAQSREVLLTAPHTMRQLCMVEYQGIMAELVTSWQKSREAFLSDVGCSIPKLEEIFLRAHRGRCVNEESGAAIILGACCAVLRRRVALSWFSRTVAAAHRAGQLEFLWKAHLDLAQFCLTQEKTLWEGAGLHAQEAQRLIYLDLSRRRPEARLLREDFYMLALAQLTRIWSTLQDPRAHNLMRDYPRVADLFHDGLRDLREDRHARIQPLHISEGYNDYFMMN
jgi:hypothetical protein